MKRNSNVICCLDAAKAAIDRAIKEYAAINKDDNLTCDCGPLFATIDNIETAHQELLDAKSIAIKGSIRT